LLQTLIDGTPTGGTLTVPACLYREEVTVPRSMTLTTSGAEIRGSDVWTSWSGNVSTQTLPVFWSYGPAVCGGDLRCALVEQVFVDGAAQYQRPDGSSPSGGQFAMDSGRHVVLGSNPSGHVVEVSTRAYWMHVYANDVTVNGFRMKHSIVTAQHGGLEVGNDSVVYDRATISNNVLSDTSGGVLELHRGSGHRVVGNNISRGGQLGMGYGGAADGSSAGTLIQGNAIHDNNTEDFDPGWEAGGLKTCFTRNISVDANTVYGNKGAGLWFDCNVTGAVVTNNVVHHNWAIGIFIETVSGATVAYNEVWETTWGSGGGWAYGGGIVVSSSGNGIDVHHNTVAWTPDGVSVLEQNRADRIETTGVYVHENDIFQARYASDTSDAMMLGWACDYSCLMFDTASNNRGALNRYWNRDAQPTWCRFTWAGCKSDLASFNATPGEEGGVYLTDAQKDAVLTSAGIPTAPESR